MNKAGKLTMVKAVMTSICTHTLISLKVPDWVFQEIDKLRRGFRWAGKQTTTGDKCLVAWTTSCKPTDLGGLGIMDLRIASYALRMRWLWLKKTDANRPWRKLQFQLGNDSMLQQMFQASIQVQIGDGNMALFWIDRWNDDSSPSIVAPNLCKLVRTRIRNR